LDLIPKADMKMKKMKLMALTDMTTNTQRTMVKGKDQEEKLLKKGKKQQSIFS